MGQNTNCFYDILKVYDLSNVLNPDSIIDDGFEKYKRPDPLGYIDTNFRRFQIHFTSFEKSKTNPYEYVINGKTKVSDNVCSFIGTITIIAAEYDTSDLMKLIGFPTYRGGSITSQVLIYEDKMHSGSGIIKGKLTTDIYINDNGTICYQALMLVADGFCNNQFEGNWTSYKTGEKKKCNWGDFRIPYSKDLDGGTCEFSVEPKYVNNGWTTYEQAWGHSPDTTIVKFARQKEMEQWWK
ncbi:MAG: hypothetical protein Q8928_04415 [Bacteroidota bacterium]|nr:hypothetical protein [Bacteroidota bacterium]